MKTILILSLFGFSLQKPFLHTSEFSEEIPGNENNIETAEITAGRDGMKEYTLNPELKIVSLLDQIILKSLRVQRLSVISERRERRRRRRKLRKSQKEGDMIPLARVG